eukprot:1875905-Pleurochrysis_carterae.AAC.1
MERKRESRVNDAAHLCGVVPQSCGEGAASAHNASTRSRGWISREKNDSNSSTRARPAERTLPFRASRAHAETTLKCARQRQTLPDKFVLSKVRQEE